MPETSLADEIRELRKLKESHSRSSTDKKEAESAFKQFQQRIYDRMEAEGIDGMRVDGVLFTPVEQVYAQVQDRRTFVAWELDRWRDELATVIHDAVSGLSPEDDPSGAAADAVIDWSMHGPELIQWEEVGDTLNSLVRRCLDDQSDLPPGVGVRPRQYVSQRAS